MLIEGHLQNDMKRLGKTFKEVHEHLDEFKGEGKFYDLKRHSFEHLLNQFIEGVWDIQQLRSAIHHLLDDFGGELILEEDYADKKHWINKILEKRCIQ